MYHLLDALDNCDVEMPYLSALELFVLISSLQLAWRHPRGGRELKEMQRSIGEALAHQFEHKPEIAALLALGWDRRFDERIAKGWD